MDDQFYKEVLEENKDAVKRAVKEAMLESVKQKFGWGLPDALKKTVDEFLKEEILPAIRADLLENKDAIVAAATDAVRGAPAEIGKALQEHLAKNLTDSWKLRKVTEALFQ